MDKMAIILVAFAALAVLNIISFSLMLAVQIALLAAGAYLLVR